MTARGSDRWLRWLAASGVLAAVGVAVWSFGPERAPERGLPTREQLRGASERSLVEHAGARAWSSSAAARIRGRIVDPSAGPLTEGRVELHCMGSAYQASAAIDEEGRFEAPSCSAGPTCVRLVHPALEQPRAWELEPGAELELEARAAPQLSGTVVGPNREPVSAAELLVSHGASRVAVASDAAGEFAVAFPRVRPCDRCDAEPGEPSCTSSASDDQPVRVLALAPGFAPQELELALRDDEVEIVLSAAAPALTGHVVGHDGTPFDRTRVLAINRARDDEQHATEVDARGWFSFDDLADAEYSLRAIRDERELATIPLARPGDEVELRSDLAAQGSALTLEIVDAEGEPIAGARIDGGPWRAALSDAQGRVEASAVLPGIYTVRVRAADCGPVREAITLEPSTAAWLHRVQLPENC